MSTRSNAFLLSVILVLQVIFILFVIPPGVQAGSQENPELTDTVGDAPSQDCDIKAVWVGEETNETIQLIMQMADWPIYSTDTNTIQYMVYFTVKDENYAVGVTFYLKGPLGLPSSIALFKVTYDPYDENNITEESQGAAGCTHSQSSGTDSIIITVPKSEIGSPKRDDKMTHIWAAVYNYGTTFPPGTGTRTTEDKAGSYSQPGREYVFTGSVVIIDFTLSCNTPVREVDSGQSAVFFINVTNNSTTPITMQISWSDVPKGWNVSSVPKGNLSVNMNQTRQFTVTVTPPADAANNTEADIYIIGSVALEDGTNHTEKIKVRTRVVITNQGQNISPPSSLDLGKIIGPWGLPIIAVLVIFVIIGVFVSLRKKPLKGPSTETKEEKSNN